MRVSRTEPIHPTHGRIVGFTATQGIYAGEKFRFSPQLNVLVGGRGAGKSAAIDLLRFAFEAEPRTDDSNSEVFANRIVGFLQSAGEVLVVLTGRDGETYIITRSGAFERHRARAKAEFTDPAQVYQLVDADLVRRDVHPLEVLGIEFYGQGEAARLADRVDEQLRLIDENLDHSDARASIARAELQLITAEDQLLEHKQALEGLRVEAATQPQLEERQAILAKSLSDPIFTERARWDTENAWIQQQQDWVQAALASLPTDLPPRTGIDVDIDGSPAAATLEKVRAASEQIRETGQADLKRSRESISGAAAALEGHRADWSTAFETAKDDYRARLAEIGAASRICSRCRAAKRAE